MVLGGKAFFDFREGRSVAWHYVVCGWTLGIPWLSYMIFTYLIFDDQVGFGKLGLISMLHG